MTPTPRHPPLAAARCSRAAFTLIELLTVIAIIGILAAIIIPTVGKVRQTAQSSVCKSNLRQTATALQLYAADNRGQYPAPRHTDANNPSSNANPVGPWPLEIAPYLSPKLMEGRISMFRLKEHEPKSNAGYCPSYFALWSSISAIQATNLNTLGYGMNFNLNVGGRSLNTAAGRVTRFQAARIVNPSRQILIGDSGDYHIDGKTSGWMGSTSSSYPDGYASGAPKRHGGNANYLFADGHVETLSPDAAIAILPFQP